MDEAVKNLLLTTLAGLALAHLPASAQTLPDPTRPPPGLDRGVAEPGAGDGVPRLQSVLIARHAGGRHVAVIDGQTVRLGETFKGARLAQVSADAVLLVRGAARQVLRMDAPLTGMTPAVK